MDTSRRPSSSAAISTPVSTGRLSSVDAALTTWRSPSERSPAARVTDSPTGSGRLGYSSAGIEFKKNSDRPPETRGRSPVASISIAPGSKCRTMSAANLAGSTATPSCAPATSIHEVIVSSRSLPVTDSRSPVRERRTPERTGRTLRVVEARPAMARASTSTSRSHRNFT